MRRLDPQLERGLRVTLAQWRRLRLGEALAVLVGALSLAWLVLGALVWRGLVREPLLAGALAALLFLTGGAAFVVVLFVCLLTRRSPAYLSERLERVHPSLQDRLNTLVWLDHSSATPESYRVRIERQAREAIALEPLPSPFSARRLAWVWALSLALLAATVVFFVETRPWALLAPRERGASADGPDAEQKLKLPPPDDAAELQRSWGEVRITEPGRDLKVTKVDVVPLQIEAASSETLRQAQWLTALGSEAPRRHNLPAPREPHYAVYKPLLYVDELRLSDWDVLTYHATAATSAGSYASEVYFLEVRPFREDILKLPGGEGGAGYAFLSELTALIDQQKHAIRETHGFLARRYEQSLARRQDRDALASAELGLAEAARHLYARIAARAENRDVGVVLENLASAEELLRVAGGALSADDPKAPGHERDALSALVATRKNLQKVISEGALGGGGGDGAEGDDEASPVVELPDKLKQISEFRDADKAGRELLERAVAEQRRLLSKVERTSAGERAALAPQPEMMRRELSDFAASHPSLFTHAEKQRVVADEALRRASEALADPSQADAVAPQRSALRALEALRDAVRRSGAERQLQQAYELKELLDEQAKGLARVEAEPVAPSREELERKAEDSKQTSREMKRLVEQTPVGDALPGALERALAETRQAERERKLDALPQATGGDARRHAAREAREDLEGLSRAFEQSEPALSRALRRSDPLKESADEAFERGLRQLEGLVAQLEAGRASEGGDAERRRELLFNLRHGVEGLYGQNERSRRLLLLVEGELTRADLRADPRKLRRLLEEIEQFRVEMGEARLARENERALRHVDAAKLPAAYRDRIQRYYQRLSEAPE